MDIVEEQVRFDAESLSLEGRLAYPEDHAPEMTVCLLAPHPFFGGDLDNNVIKHLAQDFATRGAATLRFNYRGVGESEIDLPEGTSRFAWFEAMEKDRAYQALVPDAVAAMNFLNATVPNTKRRILMGYSFGAVLAGMAAAQTSATDLVAISPPVTRVPLDAYRNCSVPKYFLAGDADFVFDEQEFLGAYEAMRDPKAWIPMPGCDHFYRGKEADLAATVAQVMGV